MNRFLTLLALAGFFAGIVLLAGTLPGCGKLESGDIITGPTQPPADDFGQVEANAARMQTWIDRMDPYVTQAPDGAYSLDWQGFLISISATHPEVVRYFAVGGQPSDDAKVVEQLKDGIPAANVALQVEASDKAASPQGRVCWTFWWGKKCCYWGVDGAQLVALIALPAYIPPWGWGLIPFSHLAAYYMQAYGGFCVDWTWAGCIWMEHT